MNATSLATGRPTWRPAIVATGAAALALAAGLVLGVNGYLGVVALLVVGSMAVLGAGLQLGRPFFGIALLVLTAVVFPVEFRGPAGVMMGSSFPLTAVLCAAWIVRLIVVPGRSAFARTRLAYANVAFMAACLISFLAGLVPLFPAGGAPVPAQIAQLGMFLCSALLLIAVADQVETPAELRWLTWILIVAGTVTCVLQMVPEARLISRYTTRPGSVGSLFWTWLVAVSASQALFNRRLSGPVRLALIGVCALVLGHGLLQVRSWASGWLPPLVALGVLAVLRFPVLTIVSGLVTAPVGMLAWGYLSAAVMDEEKYSLLTRQEAWRVLWNIVERSPIVGSGPANYYYYTENFPILGWYVRFNSHNQYQDLLVQLGFLGVAAFAWLAIEAAWASWRTFREQPVGFERAYAAGALAGLGGSLAAGMLGDWIVPFYYNAGIISFRSSLLFWVFIGGVLAIQRMHRQQPLPAAGAAAAPRGTSW